MRSYTPPIDALLAEPRLNALGPGTPNEHARSRLTALSIETAFAPHALLDRDMATCCLAGLWLYQDFLDQAHSVSQDIATREGSYWHAIMHRREPDASNAAYWFRRVSEHPIFEALYREARELGLRLHSERWSAFEFVDLCEKHRGTGTEQEELIRRVQQREWGLLFDWCYSRAIGEK